MRMQGAIFERKYELDSLMSVLKLARLCAAFASTCTRPSRRTQLRTRAVPHGCVSAALCVVLCLAPVCRRCRGRPLGACRVSVELQVVWSHVHGLAGMKRACGVAAAERRSRRYYNATSDVTCFGADYVDSVGAIIDAVVAQQARTLSETAAPIPLGRFTLAIPTLAHSHLGTSPTRHSHFSSKASA